MPPFGSENFVSRFYIGKSFSPFDLGHLAPATNFSGGGKVSRLRSSESERQILYWLE
jgi:hypothetical protein